ncbi:MAG: PAS domain S-box protein, partial [Caldithrix sp.]|nr:PAS domain S-box protein [Caldithrix sp.]
ATLDKLLRQQNLLEDSEEQIRLLLNSTAEGIYGIDNQGRCTMVNQSALNILGYTGTDQLLGKNMHDVVHHTKSDGTKYSEEECKIYNAIKNGQKTHSDQEWLWRADGKGFPAEYFSYPIFKQGKLSGAVVTFFDITERKQTENELLKLKQELEKQVTERTEELQQKVKKLDRSQKAMLFMVEDLNRITQELKNERHKLELSNQELQAFTYSVSHDLRAPLRAINGYANFLVEDYAERLDDEGKRFIDTIRENANRMDELITDLLNLSRVSRRALNSTKVDMQALVKTVYEDVATKEEQKQFKFTVDDVKPVWCDHSLIKQVWHNLISNALKYSSKSNTKEIDVYCSEDQNSITYCVADKGTGFNNKYIDKLFGVFQRLHRDSEYEGTGVGLAIVKRIVQRHGGQVWADGQINKGAKFCFSIPVH